MEKIQLVSHPYYICDLAFKKFGNNLLIEFEYVISIISENEKDKFRKSKIQMTI